MVCAVRRARRAGRCERRNGAHLPIEGKLQSTRAALDRRAGPALLVSRRRPDRDWQAARRGGAGFRTRFSRWGTARRRVAASAERSSAHSRRHRVADRAGVRHRADGAVNWSGRSPTRRVGSAIVEVIGRAAARARTRQRGRDVLRWRRAVKCDRRAARPHRRERPNGSSRCSAKAGGVRAELGRIKEGKRGLPIYSRGAGGILGSRAATRPNGVTRFPRCRTGDRRGPPLSGCRRRNAPQTVGRCT